MMKGMTTKATIIRGVARWQGILKADILPGNEVTVGNRLADFAKNGDWPEVFMVLEDETDYVLPYQWRPGGKSWFTVLHQAAWHGASLQVVDKLIKRGALRSLQDAKRRTAFDVAMERGHSHLFKRLHPSQPPVDPFRLSQLDQRLAEFIYQSPFLVEMVDTGNFTAPPDWSKLLRCPPVQILPELRQQRVWFPIGVDWGFRVTLHQGFLEVIIWNTKFHVSLAHIVTADDVILVDEGFF
jgi:Ankyrin repeats (many copies)